MIDLTPERALIFRITHIKNVEWALANGLHSASSTTKDPNFRAIGNPELIAKRADRAIPIPPHGTLSDYIPFYFTPYSPMMLNIKTGYNGIMVVPLDEIVILVAQLRELVDRGIEFVYSDRHAYLATAKFFRDLKHLDRIDWRIIRSRDFKRDPDDPGKFERYQAETLVHGHLPCGALTGIVCRNDAAAKRVRRLVDGAEAAVEVVTRPSYYL